jgi:hypothetical protein
MANARRASKQAAGKMPHAINAYFSAWLALHRAG